LYSVLTLLVERRTNFFHFFGMAPGRTFATNVRSVDHEDIPWPELVARIKPYISTSPLLFRGTTAAPQRAAVRGAVAPHHIHTHTRPCRQGNVPGQQANSDVIHQATKALATMGGAPRPIDDWVGIVDKVMGGLDELSKSPS